MAHGNDRVENDDGALVLGIRGDEAAIHLQGIEGQLAQARQRGIAGAEVIAGNADTLLAQTLEDLRGAFGVLHHQRLGDFDLEAAALQVFAADQLLHVIEKVWLDQLRRGNIHGDENRFGRAVGALPDTQLTASLVQHGAADVADHAGLFGKADETLGRQQAERGVAPAHQGLETGEMQIGQPGDRLIMNFDLVSLDGAAQFLFQNHQLGALVQHRRIIQFDGARTAAFGFIKSYGRILHHLLSRHGRIAHMGEAHRGGQKKLLTIERDGPGYGLEQARGKLAGIAGAILLAEEDGEFVAGKPGNRIGRFDPGFQAAADHGQQRIAGIVAHGVVHHLETVKIDDQHEEMILRLLPACHGAGQPVDEQGAVGKAGHDIIDGILQQALPGDLGIGHIGQCANAAHGALALASDGAGPQLEPAVTAIAMAQPEILLDRRAAVVARLLDGGEIGVAVSGVHEFEEGLGTGLGQNPGGQSQRPLYLGTDEEFAILGLPVPDIGPGTGQGQGMAAGLAEEIARQETLAEGVMRQRKSQYDQNGAESGQENARQHRAAIARQGGDRRQKGPEKYRCPGHECCLGLGLAAPPEQEDEEKTASRRCRENAAGDGGGEQWFGKTIDRDGKSQAAKNQQQIAGQAPDALQFRQRGQQKKQECRHRSFDDGARRLQAQPLQRSRLDNRWQMACLEHHEGNTGQGKTAGHRKYGARAEAIECKKSEREQHRNA